MINITKTKIGIFFKHVEWADKVWNELEKSIPADNIRFCKKLRNYRDTNIVLQDDTVIKFVKASEYARGCKFDKVYYEDCIEDDILYDVVTPCLGVKRHFPLMLED